MHIYLYTLITVQQENGNVNSSMNDVVDNCGESLPFFFSMFTSQNLSDDPLFFMARRPYEEPRMRNDLGSMVVKCRSCGSLHWMDEKLRSSSTTYPIFGLCCNSGKVDLPKLRDPPQTLKTLLESNDREGNDFRENI